MNPTLRDDEPARFLWLPPLLRPPIRLPRRQELVFLLVGTTLMFSNYDLNVFGLALPEIQRALKIPDDITGITIGYFSLAGIAAMLVAPLADIFGRRRLLLITVCGEAIFTIASGCTHNYVQFVSMQILARIFGFSEDLLCFVVITEEIDERVRGWAMGTLAAMGATGAGIAALIFGLINVLPYGWRALYVIGGSSLFMLAYYRRLLPETARFEIRKGQLTALEAKSISGWKMAVKLCREYPARLGALLVAVGAFFFSVVPAVVLVSKYLQETHNYRPPEISLLFLLGGFVSLVGSVVAGRVSDRIGRKAVICLCSVTCGLSYAFLYSGYDGRWLPLAWILATFGYIASGTLMTGYGTELFPTAYRATAATLRNVASTLGGGFAMALESVLYDQFGSLGPAVIVFIAAMPIALGSILLLSEVARRSLEDISGPSEGSSTPNGNTGT